VSGFVKKVIRWSVRPYGASRDGASRDGALRADGAIGCEHFGGLTRIKADTMTLRGYKSRKSTRFAPERLLLLWLPR
jgi:hypothetical protein